jgi:hypothetical protein
MATIDVLTITFFFVKIPPWSFLDDDQPFFKKSYAAANGF